MNSIAGRRESASIAAGKCKRKQKPEEEAAKENEAGETDGKENAEHSREMCPP
jgi:hypothetical protein